MKRLLSITLCALAPFSAASAASTIFTGGAGDTPATLSSRNGATPGPAIDPAAGNPGAGLVLTEAANGLQNTATFDRTQVGTVPSSTFSFQFRIEAPITPSADGFSFSYLDTGAYGTSGDGPLLGEDPQAAGVLGFGFDTWSNNGGGGGPDDPAQPQGSDYHEISLFYNNNLIQRIDNTRLLTPGLFLDDGTYHTVTGLINFAGATASLSVDGTSIFNNVPVPGLVPFESRIEFGARTGGENERVSIDNLNVSFVPEPSVATVALLGVGLLARRRRRR